MTKNKSLRAIEAAGGKSAVAQKLLLSPTAVSKWCEKDSIPANYVIEICRMTDCLFQPNMLRPDIFDASQTVSKLEV